MSPVILYVEDETDLRQDLRADLEAEGYTVHEAADGTEALAKIDALRPDLVLCDIKMPGLSGHEVLARVRARRDDAASTPFVMLTALHDRGNQLEGRRRGADDYVTKPVDFDLLLATIQTRLSNAQRMRAVGGRRLDRLERLFEERMAALNPECPLDGRAAALQAALPEAIADHRFALYLQPKVSLSDGTVVGAEALLRWTHPTLGPVSPARFMPIAERQGLAPAIGRWVQHEVMRQAAALARRGLALPISFNLSATELEPGLPERMAAAIATAGARPDLLQVEITESAAVKDLPTAIRVADAVHRLGVSVALDDFGTGYASLAYVRDFPVDTLKIDGSFISSLPDNAVEQQIVETILSLSRSLGFTVVAEGVETTEQARVLERMGCTIIQGFLFSPALPFDAFVRYVVERNRVPRLAAR